MGVVGRLGKCDAERPGYDRHQGDKPVTAAIFRLHGRAAERLAITHQLVQTLCPTWDLADHPGLQHLTKLLQVGLIEQVEEGGIGGTSLEVQAERLVQRLPVPPGKGFQITGAAATAQDPQHRHQQQKPLRITHPAAVAAIRDGLEGADQVIRFGLIN